MLEIQKTIDISEQENILEYLNEQVFLPSLDKQLKDKLKQVLFLE